MPINKLFTCNRYIDLNRNIIKYNHRFNNKLRYFTSNDIIYTYNNLNNEQKLELIINWSNNISNEQIFRYLNSNKDSLNFIISLKDDLKNMKILSINKSTTSFIESINTWLSVMLSSDNLILNQISFDKSSGSMLEKVAQGDSVRKIRSIRELKRRLSQGRRCYAYFHPSLINEPLAFIHIALTPILATSLSIINSKSTEQSPSHAMFYSVNSPIQALSGFDLGVRLIKESKNEIKKSYPTVRVYSTLSPLPSFLIWLRSLINPAEYGKQQNTDEINKMNIPEVIVKDMIHFIKFIRNESLNEYNKYNCINWLIMITTDTNWASNEQVISNIKPLLLWLAEYYLNNVKSERSIALPRDPVARFHLRNGAIIKSINWMADPSESGLKASAGIMINYLYEDLDNNYL